MTTGRRCAVDDLDRKVGARMRAARERQGVTQEQLGAALTNEFGLSVHQTMMGKIEKGVRPLKLKEAVAISLFLSIDLAELVFDDPGLVAEDSAADRVFEELAAVKGIIRTRMLRLRPPRVCFTDPQGGAR